MPILYVKETIFCYFITTFCVIIFPVAEVIISWYTPAGRLRSSWICLLLFFPNNISGPLYTCWPAWLITCILYWPDSIFKNCTCMFLFSTGFGYTVIVGLLPESDCLSASTETTPFPEISLFFTVYSTNYSIIYFKKPSGKEI